MIAVLLSFGLLAGGTLGFLAGIRPDLLLGGPNPGDPRTSARAREAMEMLYPLAAAFFAGFVFSTLVPEALLHSRGTLAAFAAGAAGMGLLSRLVLKRDPCCEGGHDHKGLGAMSLVAMAVCSVNDGLLLGWAQPSWHSGLNLGLLLHKVTSSFAIAQLLLRGGYRGFPLAAFGAAYALVSPVALLAAGPAARGLPGLEIALGFSAGILAYVTLASLVPHAGGILLRRPKVRLGFALALLLSLGIGVWHRAMHGRAEGQEAGHGAVGDPGPANGAAPHSHPAGTPHPHTGLGGSP